MGTLPIRITILFFAGFAFSCEDSLLIVGGQDASGPLSSMHLLTPAGWCQDVNFPSLPEPVINPAVHVFTPANTDRHILIVCGFSSDPCMWSESGGDSWTSLPLQDVDDAPVRNDHISSRTLKIVGLDLQSLVMVSTQEGDNFVGLTHTNNLNWFQEQEDSANPWVLAKDQTAKFSLTGRNAAWQLFTKNMTGSCLARLGQEMLLSGGRTSELPMDSASRVKDSEATVGRMSPDGPINCDAVECEPMWEAGVVPDLMEGRDEHACLGTLLEGKEVIMVGGGTKFDFIGGKSGWSYYTERENFETLSSVEIYDGSVWKSGGEFNAARTGFGLVEMCGEVVAVGGRQYDGQYRWERQYNGRPDCGEPCWEETVTDTIAETFLDTIEILEGSQSWGLSDIKLPQPMANFGVVTASKLTCKV